MKITRYLLESIKLTALSGVIAPVVWSILDTGSHGSLAAQTPLAINR